MFMFKTSIWVASIYVRPLNLSLGLTSLAVSIHAAVFVYLLVSTLMTLMPSMVP